MSEANYSARNTVVCEGSNALDAVHVDCREFRGVVNEALPLIERVPVGISHKAVGSIEENRGSANFILCMG